MYTDPQISKGKEWLVFFRYQGKSSPFKFRNGLNKKGLSKAERNAAAIALRDNLSRQLKNGWNPLLEEFDENGYPDKPALQEQSAISPVITSTLEQWSKSPQRNPLVLKVPAGQATDIFNKEFDFKLSDKNMLFDEAIEFALRVKKPYLSKKSISDYKSTIKYLKEAVAILDINYPVREYEVETFKFILEQAKYNRGLTPGGYNKYRTHLSAMVTEMCQWGISRANLVRVVDEKVTIEVEAHKPPTETERIMIVNHLKKKHPAFYTFCACLYATTIREKEMLALRIGEVDLDRQQIVIIPDAERENSKVKHERKVIIPDSLVGLLRHMRLETYPMDYYLFSTDNKYRSFLPGPNKMHPNTPTGTWRRHIKERMKIDKDLYGLKKKGGDDMIDLQVKHHVKDLLELPKRQMGHKRDSTTEIYVKRHKDIIDEIFKRFMPAL